MEFGRFSETTNLHLQDIGGRHNVMDVSRNAGDSIVIREINPHTETNIHSVGGVQHASNVYT
eukprot:4694125-Pleurochrysis_carterae.AAC.1